MKDSEILDGRFVEKTIAENLLARLTVSQAPHAMSMTRTVRQQARALLRDFFAASSGRHLDKPLLAQLFHASQEEVVKMAPQANLAPVRRDITGTVITVDFGSRKPRA